MRFISRCYWILKLKEYLGKMNDLPKHHGRAQCSCIGLKLSLRKPMQWLMWGQWLKWQLRPSLPVPVFLIKYSVLGWDTKTNWTQASIQLSVINQMGRNVASTFCHEIIKKFPAEPLAAIRGNLDEKHWIRQTRWKQ